MVYMIRNVDTGKYFKDFETRPHNPYLKRKGFNVSIDKGLKFSDPKDCDNFISKLKGNYECVAVVNYIEVENKKGNKISFECRDDFIKLDIVADIIEKIKAGDYILKEWKIW